MINCALLPRSWVSALASALGDEWRAYAEGIGLQAGKSSRITRNSAKSLMQADLGETVCKASSVVFEIWEAPFVVQWSPPQDFKGVFFLGKSKI